MKQLAFVLLFLISCSGSSFIYPPEHERQEMYWLWLKACGLQGRVVFSVDTQKRCVARNQCVPSSIDWQWVYYIDPEKDARFPMGRPAPRNRLVCASQAGVAEALRGL